MGGREFRRCSCPQSVLKPVASARGSGQRRRDRIGVPVHSEGLRERESPQVAHVDGEGEGHVGRRREWVSRNLLHHYVQGNWQHTQADHSRTGEAATRTVNGEGMISRRGVERCGERDDRLGCRCDRVGRPDGRRAGEQVAHGELHGFGKAVLARQMHCIGDALPLGHGLGRRRHAQGKFWMQGNGEYH